MTDNVDFEKFTRFDKSIHKHLLSLVDASTTRQMVEDTVMLCAILSKHMAQLAPMVILASSPEAFDELLNTTREAAYKNTKAATEEVKNDNNIKDYESLERCIDDTMKQVNAIIGEASA
jgi:hypothetical protein